MGDAYQDELNAKLQAEKAYQARGYGNGIGAAPVRDCDTMQAQSTRSYTLKEEAGKACEHHSNQAQKFAAAHAFLTAHPEFDEFIRLIRNGSLQF